MDKEIIKPYGFIYETTNMINNRKYIGQKRYDKQWGKYLGSGTSFKLALKKYGKENFSRSIITVAYSKHELDVLEIKIIKKYNAVEDRNYYNISYGGNTPQYGIPRTDEVKKRISKKLIGKIISNDTRIKMRLAQKGEHNPFFNKHHTKEEIELIRKASTGRLHTEESKIKMSIVQKALNHFKFNVLKVNEIRNKYLTGDYSQKKLAIEYNCGTSTIFRIIKCERGYENIN